MSELAQRSGLPVATIKFYLREGLLPPGEATGATRARYDEVHVRRLRLGRALVEGAGLRLEEVRRILTAVDDDTLPLHEVVGTAHTQLSAGAPPAREARRRADSLVRRWGWRVARDSAHRDALARALAALSSLDHPTSDSLLDAYAEAMGPIAVQEVSTIAGLDPTTATENAVVGTVLLEPVLLAVRRMAQEHASATRLAGARRRSRGR